MMKRIIQGVIWSIVIVFFLFSVLFSLLRYYTSDLSRYQTEIIERITKITGAPFSFETLESSWHGFSPTFIFKKVDFVAVPGPEITVHAEKINIQINIFASLLKRSAVFHYVFVDDIAIDIRHKYPPKKDPREVLHNALSFLPSLNSAGLNNAHLRIFLSKEAKAPDIEFKNLSVFFYDHQFKGYQLDFIEEKNGKVSKMVWSWKSAKNAHIFLDLDNYSLPIPLSREVFLHGKIWGVWEKKDLSYLRGSFSALDTEFSKPLPLNMWFSNDNGYQIDFVSDFMIARARVFQGRYGIQLDRFDLNGLRAYVSSLPKILDELKIAHAWGSGIMRQQIDSLKVVVEDLGIKISSNDDLPHIDHLGFVVQGDLAKGAISFTKGLRLRQGFFKENLADIQIANQFPYLYEDGRLTLFPNSLIHHDSVDADVKGQFSIAFRQGYRPAIYSNLYGKINPVPIKDILRYLPKAHIPASVHTWLDNALVDSGNTKGLASWGLWGDLRHSPWEKENDAKTSYFRAEFDTDKAILDVMPKELVPLADVDAHVIIENNFLGVKAKRTTLLSNITLSDIKVDIPHFQRAYLDIEGEIQGAFSHIQDYFAQSPFLNSIHEVTNQFSGKSLLSGNLVMKIPLAIEETPPLSIAGYVDFKEAEILYTPLALPMKKARGRIIFDERGLKASKDVKASIYDQETAVSIDRVSQGTQITFTGPQDPKVWLKKYAAWLVNYVEVKGLAITQGTVTIPFVNQNNWALEVLADLRKVTIDASFGFDKAQGVKSELNVKIQNDTDRKMRVNIAVANLLSVEIKNPDQKRWEALSIVVDTAEAKGSIRSLSPKKFDINFDYLVIPYGSRLTKNAAQSLDPTQTFFNQLSYKELPESDLKINKLYRGNEFLGRLEMQSRFINNYWQIKPINLVSDDHKIIGSLEWHPEDRITRTRVQADFETYQSNAINNLAGMDLGLTGLMQGAFTLSSSKNLEQITLGDIDLKSTLRVNQGNMRSVSIGPLRALGAMNIDTIARRLKLDFRDLKDTGFSFDSAEGLIDLNNNRLYLNNILVNAPSLNAKLQGVVDLSKREYDIDVKAFPKASVLAPIAGTLIGGPVIGAGVLVFERLFDDEINKLPRTEFQWKGTFK